MSKYFITKYGYLSVDKDFLHTTNEKIIQVGHHLLSIPILKQTITYKDNVGYYRWKFKDFMKASIQ